MQLQNLMTQAGFTEVEGRLLTLPLSGWSNGILFPLQMYGEDVSEPQQIHETERSESRTVRISTDCCRHWRYIRSLKAWGMFVLWPVTPKSYKALDLT